MIGGGGADSLNGGAGDDVLISGNTEVEGAGEDLIEVEYEGNTAPVLETLDRGDDVIIVIGDDILALIEDGAGLSFANLRLVQAG